MKRIASMSLYALTGLLTASLPLAAYSAEPLPNDDWLHVEGNLIKDSQGNTVWLTGANWFGFNTTERVLHGLWSVNLEATLQDIAARGINILRIPISTELLYEWQNGVYSNANVNTSTNPDLVGATSLDVFDAMMVGSKKVGLKILLDVHGAEADNMGHIQPLWYKGDITPEIYYSTWEWVVDRYKNDDTLIAVDLENEPHGQAYRDEEFAKWDNSTDDNNWKYACETAANRVLDINPNMLIMCEGIESYPVDGQTWTSKDKDDYFSNWWGGNLRGVRDYPVDLGSRQSQFMYSPHDYGPLVFEQKWFYEGFNKETLYQDVWKDNWMFIHEENISPLLIGEWGGFMDGGDNETWMYAIRDLIIENGLHHTFWCINPNSGDTGGLLASDWVTWDEAKYAVLEPSLWRDNSGKFIGLDHQVALGSSSTGVSLGEHTDSLSSSVSIVSPNEDSFVLTNSEVVVGYQSSRTDSVNVYVDGVFASHQSSGGSVTVTAPSSERSFIIEIRAIDSDGNELSVSDSLRLNAVNDTQLNPQISFLTPKPEEKVEVGSRIQVTVELSDADGFSAELAGVIKKTSGVSLVIDAPNTAGEYVLTVTALNDQLESLGVTQEQTLSVTELPTVDLSCVVGAADVWNNGFVINTISVTNNGDSTISSWDAQLLFPETIRFVNGWNGQFSANGSDIAVTPIEYNSSLTAGQTVSFGLQGEHDGQFTPPSCILRSGQ